MDVYLRRQGRRSRKKAKMGERVAGGGAGDIHLSPQFPDQVLKIYRNPVDQRAYKPKIEAMLSAPPRIFSFKHLGKERHQLAWPTHLAETEGGDFLGFAMPQIDFGSSVSLERMLQKRMRERAGLPEYYGYRISAAYNLAASVGALHAQNHHIIDLKPVNCRIYTDSMILALLDCDGFSIHGESKRFPAGQFTAEYIAPEATGKSPEELGVEQDLFALAVTIFRLLNNGLHPFQARLISGENGGTLQEMIEAGHYPYALSGASGCIPPRQSIHASFPDELRKAFDQAFLRKSRPTAAKWRDLLRPFADPSSGKLIRCEVDPQNHAHFGFGCGWCELEANLKATGQSARPTNRTQAKGPPTSPSNAGINLSQLTPFRTKRMVWLVFVSMILSLIVSSYLVEKEDHELVPGQPAETQNSPPSPTVSEPEKSFDMTPVNAVGFVTQNADLRRVPSTKSAIIGSLRGGGEILVVAKVDGRNWYFVEKLHDDRSRGYIHGGSVALFLSERRLGE